MTTALSPDRTILMKMISRIEAAYGRCNSTRNPRCESGAGAQPFDLPAVTVEPGRARSRLDDGECSRESLNMLRPSHDGRISRCLARVPQRPPRQAFPAVTLNA